MTWSNPYWRHTGYCEDCGLALFTRTQPGPFPDPRDGLPPHPERWCYCDLERER